MRFPKIKGNRMALIRANSTDRPCRGKIDICYDVPRMLDGAATIRKTFLVKMFGSERWRPGLDKLHLTKDGGPRIAVYCSRS